MRTPIDTEKIRRDFPILADGAHRDAIYLDSAATSLMPGPVIAAMSNYYSSAAGGGHRSIHKLARSASNLYRTARMTVASFIGAREDEVIFVKNATEGLNLLAASCPLEPAQTVALTAANHHSAWLPWQRRSATTLIPVEADGTISVSGLRQGITHRTGVVCLPAVCNALGIAMPVTEAAHLARRVRALVVVDGTQSVPHRATDVSSAGCDALVWSAHKMLGPQGIGVLYSSQALLCRLKPYLLGGDMVNAVNADGSFDVKDGAEGFEAGTPNVAGAIGLAAAIDYLEGIGMPRVHEHVTMLAEAAFRRLRQIPRLDLYGPVSGERSAVTFGFPGMSAHALAVLLSNRYNIMIRSGFQCAQPYHQALGLAGSCRASFYIYNTLEEVDALARALRALSETLDRTAPAVA